MKSAAITTGDRLGMTLFMAAALHVAVILGVGFTAPDPNRDAPPLIEVTVAQTPADETPEDFDFLAAYDQEGGGTADEAIEPAEPASMIPDPRDLEDPLSAAPHQRPQPQLDDTEVLTRDDADEVVDEPDESDRQPEHSPQPDVIDSQEQVASDIADTSRSIDWNARYPSRQRIDARTRSHDAAEYMRDWIERVEQVGNLNYPDELRQRQLSGRVIVEVTLLPDGSVEQARVIDNSPYQALDDAALRVVEMAAPFPSVPEEVLEGNEQLVITRTWEFTSSGDLEAR